MSIFKIEETKKDLSIQKLSKEVLIHKGTELNALQFVLEDLLLKAWSQGLAVLTRNNIFLTKISLENDPFEDEKIFLTVMIKAVDLKDSSLKDLKFIDIANLNKSCMEIRKGSKWEK